MYLADTSAWWISRRAKTGEARRRFDELTFNAALAICDVVRFELLYSVRNGDEFAVTEARLAALPDLEINKSQWERALDVYRQLAGQGGAHHRSVGYPDLLVAAAAESAGATVLHYDEDFERIAAITGQPTRWILPRGAL
jgi:predicted nucleic acid-binding protein